MNKRGKSLWSLKFNTATIVLIPAAIGINYLGKLFASVLKLPLWLDSIGTCLSAVLAGPVVGAICGAANNIIYGISFDPISTVYALTNVAIGLIVGVMAHLGLMKNIKVCIITALVAGLGAVIVSTPLNIIFWGGTTGNVWGDAVYAWFAAHHTPIAISSFLDEIVVDLPDKIAVILIVFAITKGLPKNLIALYHSSDEIEDLDK